jgi:ABC-type maltose transport system permease subunit
MQNRRLTWAEQLRSQLALLLLSLFVIVPLLWMLRLGFDATIRSRPTDFALLPQLWSFANLTKAWEEPRAGISFLLLLRNSLIVAGATCALALACGVSAAYAFARMRFPGRRLGLFACLVLIMLPPTGLAAPYFILLSALKIRQSLLGLIMVYSVVAVPFAIWTLRSAIAGLGSEVEEAAALEGATPLRVFWAITLPLVRPALAVAGFIAFLIAWSEYAFGWALLTDPKLVTLAMALYSMRDASNVSWGLLSATALLTALPVVALFYSLGNAVIDGLSLGAAREG